MPEARLQRTRDAYADGLIRRPDGVAFATADGRLMVPLPPRYQAEWRAMHENAAEQLTRRAEQR